MSWKGLKKAVERLPQRVMSKAGYSEETVDQEMYVLEAKFNELESCTEKLYHDARKYRDAMSGLLNHQVAFGDILCDIYRGRSSGGLDTSKTDAPAKFPVSERQLPGNSSTGFSSPDAAAAAEQYAKAMAKTRDALIPELDAIDRFVVAPTNDLIGLMKGVKKSLTKREHKKVDYDRHRDNLHKLKANPNRDLNDEKKLFKLEQQVEQATKDYNYINDMLKEQLPVFLRLRMDFIDPCFISFCLLQKKAFELLLDGLQPLLRSGYFSVDVDILSNYERRRPDSQPILEMLEALRNRKAVATSTGHSAAAPEAEHFDAAASEEHDIDQLPSYDSAPGSLSTSPKAPHWSQTGATPPRAGVEVSAGSQKPSTGEFAASASSAGARLPPPKPPSFTKPTAAQSTYVVALYDYDAQVKTDLSFKKDDKIEVLRRTPDVNDWWTGRLRGEVGEFPGNYVADL